MILNQKKNALKGFDLCQYICDEIFLSHDSFRNYYRQPDETTSFANDVHSWLLKNVIWRLERVYGAIRFDVVPVQSKDKDAFCAVHVSRTSDDRIFSNMVHRAMVEMIEQKFPSWSYGLHYRLLDNETLFEEGNDKYSLFDIERKQLLRVIKNNFILKVSTVENQTGIETNQSPSSGKQSTQWKQQGQTSYPRGRAACPLSTRHYREGKIEVNRLETADLSAKVAKDASALSACKA